MRLTGLSPINRPPRPVTASFVPAASPRKQDHWLSRFATGATGLLLGATGEATRAARASRRYPPGRHGGERRKRMSRIVDLPDGHPSKAAMMARLPPLAGPTPLRFRYRHVVPGRQVASPSPLTRGCWRSSAPSATRARREGAGGARSGPAARRQEQGSTGPLAPARRRRPPRKGMMPAAMASRSRFPPPADPIPLQLQWL